MTDFLHSTVISSTQPRPGSRIEAEILQRRDIFEKTQAAEIAVLTPTDPGGLSHDLRHALAARIAALHGETAQAARYATGVTDPAFAPLADKAGVSADAQIQAMLTFTDAVSTSPREITAEDVTALQGAGISDADIVRLAELNAFLAYQLRLIAGLRLLVEGAA